MNDRKFDHAGLKSMPMPLQRALMNDEYSKGKSDFSVTQLLGPPQKTYFKQFLGEQEIVHPYTLIYSVFGTIVHNILESHVKPEEGEIAEERFFMQIQGYTVSGQVDLIMTHEKAVTDWKFIGGDQEEMKVDHFKQTQMNALLAEENGHEIETAGITYIQRDWKIMQAMLNPSYSQSAIKTFMKDYDREYAIKLFNTTVLEHGAALGGSPRPCTREEKWQNPTKYALKKPGGKRASKVCDSEQEAEDHRKPGQIIETRPATRTYCEYFCGFKHICEQYKRESLAAMSPD